MVSSVLRKSLAETFPQAEGSPCRDNSCYWEQLLPSPGCSVSRDSSSGEVYQGTSHARIQAHSKKSPMPQPVAVAANFMLSSCSLIGLICTHPSKAAQRSRLMSIVVTILRLRGGSQTKFCLSLFCISPVIQLFCVKIANALFITLLDCGEIRAQAAADLKRCSHQDSFQGFAAGKILRQLLLFNPFSSHFD